MRLLEQYQKLHNKKNFFKGDSLKPHIQEIHDLIKQTGAKSVLDYGCGKARLHRKGRTSHWGVEVSFYDPAVEAFSKKPDGFFDGVICTDVLEHIPEEELEGVLKDIFQYTVKFVFLSISTKLADKKFPDGTNVHVTVKPEKWWIEFIGKIPQSYLYGVKVLIRFK